MVRFLWSIAFFTFATSLFAGERLSALVNAAQDFSIAIREQLAAVPSDISATQLTEKMVSYAKAKTAYFNGLRTEMPEMTDIATGREPRPPDLDKFPTSLSVAGEKQKKRRMKKLLVYCNDSRANRALKKRGRISGRRKKSNSDSIMISTESISPCDNGGLLGECCQCFEPPAACRRSTIRRHRIVFCDQRFMHLTQSNALGFRVQYLRKSLAYILLFCPPLS
jgi:hypothetical protein